MTRESQAKEMICITVEEYEELTAIKEIYDRATGTTGEGTNNEPAGAANNPAGPNDDQRGPRINAASGPAPAQGKDAERDLG